MPDLFYILFLALVVIHVDFRMTKHNLGSPFNGVGAVPLVLIAKSMAPMQYRVLVPWICWALGAAFGRGTGKVLYLRVYLWVRWAAIVFALGAAHLFFGDSLCTALLAVFFVFASLYDYTDGYFEVGFFALVLWMLLHFQPWMMPVLAVVVFFAALNRETAGALPVVAFLMGLHHVGAVMLFSFAVGYSLPRIMYGDRRRYCKFNMIIDNARQIWKDLTGDKPWPYVEYLHFLALFAVIGVLYTLNGVPSAVEMVLGVLFLALMVPSKWREIRVFAPCMLAVIPMVVQWV